MEIYKASKTIPGYMVSNYGHVLNMKTGHVFSGRVNGRTGYPEINVNQNGKHKYYLVHRLVAELFCTRPDDGGLYEVNHIDGNRQNCHADNLEWITHAENLHHSYVIGHREYDVAPKAVVATNMDTGESTTFPSIYKAARFLGISQGNICMCCKGLRPYAGGYMWAYAGGGE